jgi:hypothetical protein
MLTAGGEAIADINILRHQEGVLRPVAAPTAWRALDEATPAALARVEMARPRSASRVGSAAATARVTGGRRRPRRGSGVGCRRHAGHCALGEEQARRRSRAASASTRLECGATTCPSCWPHRRADPGHRPSPGGTSEAAWKPGTGPTPSSRTGSRPPKTPAWAGSHHRSTPSTRPGCISP